MRPIGLTSVLFGLWVIHTCSAAVPNAAHNLEEDQQPAKPTNGNRLFNRAIRGSQNNAPAARLNAPPKSQATQPKPPPSPPAPVESDFQAESGEEKQEQESSEVEAIPIEELVSSTTSSTEAPKRKPGGVVRPIQSKKDFLERLERRRKLQQQNGYTIVPPTSTSTTERQVTKPNQQNTRKTNPPKTPTPPINQGSQKKTSANRRYNSKATTPVQTTPLPASSNEAIAEESNLATQSSKIRSFPKTRRTSTS